MKGTHSVCATHNSLAISVQAPEVEEEDEKDEKEEEKEEGDMPKVEL